MNLYGIICNVNEKLIKNELIENKQDIVKYILNNAPNGGKIDLNIKISKNNNNWYPHFYNPPYNNGQKLRIISGYKPKTQILSANHYELEILRILFLWANDNEIVKNMIENTLSRLNNTCFGHYCSKGECLGASVSVLRFINTIFPDKMEWIKKLFEPMSIFYREQKGMGMENNFPFYYFCLVISEMPIKFVEAYIYEKKEFLKILLTKGCLNGPKENDTYNALKLYIIRNTLSRIKEYEYIKDEEIYIKNNRCYCKI